MVCHSATIIQKRKKKKKTFSPESCAEVSKKDNLSLFAKVLGNYIPIEYIAGLNYKSILCFEMAIERPSF